MKETKKRRRFASKIQRILVRKRTALLLYFMHVNHLFWPFFSFHFFCCCSSSSSFSILRMSFVCLALPFLPKEYELTVAPRVQTKLAFHAKQNDIRAHNRIRCSQKKHKFFGISILIVFFSSSFRFVVLYFGVTRYIMSTQVDLSVIFITAKHTHRHTYMNMCV